MIYSAKELIDKVDAKLNFIIQSEQFGLDGTAEDIEKEYKEFAEMLKKEEEKKNV
jgi:predicted ATP-grasp superfamily ATP-dependent carboligase